MKTKLIHFENLNSTSEYAKTLEFDARIARVIIAELQAEGKGREGKEFVSDRGGLYFSIVIDEEAVPFNLPLVTQLAAAAVYEAFKDFNIAVSVKWPNDIILNQKKLAGILVESESRGSKIRIIAGIGINLNNDVQNVENATSLKCEGFSVAAGDLLQGVVRRFIGFYNKLKTGDTEEILDIVKQNSYILNKEVLVYKEGDILPALAKDISPEGGLIVEYKNGKSEIIYSGGVRICPKEDVPDRE